VNSQEGLSNLKITFTCWYILTLTFDHSTSKAYHSDTAYSLTVKFTLGHSESVFQPALG